LTVASALAIAACGFSRQERAVKTQDALERERAASAAEDARVAPELFGRCVENVRRRMEAGAAGAVTLDALVLSGGGDWGAFGAGVLKGWGRVQGELRRPKFDAVTGVSTGALIAPFAYLGDDASIETIDNLYRNPKDDWIDERGWISILGASASFATMPGIEREMRRIVNVDLLRAIADAGATGRMLAVSTTNVDIAELRLWDLVDEARNAVKTGDPARVHAILLASSAIPGVFPPRELDGGLYVDGGVSGNILYGGRLGNVDPFVEHWRRLFKDVAPPKIRYWVVFNNQVRAAPKTIQPIWLDVAQRSLGMTTRTATLTALRHLFAKAEVARLKHDADIEVRYLAIPDDWLPPSAISFDGSTMNALADLGERMGADPASWIEKCP
jgi:predicted acylesterase/phospholipase RssA